MIETIDLRTTQLYEIDQVLFLRDHLPYFDVDMKKCKETKTNWNDPNRIVSMLYPLPGTEKLQVLDQPFKYDIHLGKTLPSFVYMPTSMEIVWRLVLKAAASSLSDFRLEHSNL